MHSGESLVGPVDEWHESCLPLGGEGCPEVAEFAVIEFAAALGARPSPGGVTCPTRSRGATGCTRCWARLEAGELPAWRLAFIADRTLCLSPEAAAFVDAKVAAFAHKIGPAQLGRLIEEAKARFDPEATEAERLAAAEAGHFDIALAEVGVNGRVRIDGDVDLADALDLEAAIAADAHHQLLLGSTESLDVRRSIAAGNLARNQQPLDLGEDEQPSPQPPPAPQARGGAARPPRTRRGPGRRRARPPPGGPRPGHRRAGPRSGAATPTAQVTVQPVLDLAEHIHVGSYEACARLKLQTQLRDHTCAFAFCFRPAEDCDCEHRVPHDPDRDDGGPTCTCNQAPCCRRHHRAKTTGGWTYVTVEPGVYLWRSPLGYQFLKDHTGTLDVTPDEERRRLAREFRPLAHFGEP